MSNNSAVLEHADDQIRDVEAYLASLDALIQNESESKQTIVRLKSDIFELHRNTANLEQKARASKLTNAVSLLALEESDLADLHAQIAACKANVAQADRSARETLKSLNWALLQARKAAVEAKLATLIDFRKLLMRPEDLSRCAFSVTQIVDAGNMISAYPDNLDSATGIARRLREYASPILAWCAEEPGLELPEVKAADPLPSPMVEPVVTGNKLGTLAQAVEV